MSANNFQLLSQKCDIIAAQRELRRKQFCQELMSHFDAFLTSAVNNSDTKHQEEDFVKHYLVKNSGFRVFECPDVVKLTESKALSGIKVVIAMDRVRLHDPNIQFRLEPLEKQIRFEYY